jgi:hypothetical protein
VGHTHEAMEETAVVPAAAETAVANPTTQEGGMGSEAVALRTQPAPV